MKRRDFLKLSSAPIGLSLLGLSQNSTAGSYQSVEELNAVLVDLEKCTGCRKCEEACAEANGLPIPDMKDKRVFNAHREMTTDGWTVVNRHICQDGSELFTKNQCMHCNQPACAAACLVQAMEKTEEGPVIWHADRCMGCRYCMVSCPYDVPKFEYDSPVPKIQKCILCADRLKEGKLPACVEGCPVEAIIYGPRRELIEIARSRIYQNPGKYVPHIYGEHEVGGTGWLYISPKPFEELGFRTNLGDTPYPEYTQDFLYSVPLVITLWPAFLFGVSQIKKSGETEKEEV